MSTLNRPYEISLWEDVLDDEGNFQEKRLLVIGSNEMLSQDRAQNPQFGRNVNGVKTFQFEMYRYYIDNVTGQKVENPFIKYLISERKIKLYYDAKWYDFIIKDIAENSSTYLYTYKLEDAAVIELSKNGFGVILDEQENNNLGNPETLAVEVLKGTDWKVGSEVFVQKVEDALVWLSIPVETKAVHIKDQIDLKNGVQEVPVEITKKDVQSVEILAFYSSCTNKPHRFQFIYLDDWSSLTVEEGKINNKNCQYYIDLEPTAYKQVANTPFYLPENYTLFFKDGGYLYTDARAERYGFAHQTEYIPKLDRYVYKYYKRNGKDYVLDDSGKPEIYYGYYNSKYYSPSLIQSIVTNSHFDSTSGWIGTKTTKGGQKAKVRNVYGYFDSNKNFVDSADELFAGTFDPDREGLSAYLEIEFVDDTSIIINSGPYDNRFIIENMEGQWLLDAEIYQNGSLGPISLGDNDVQVDIGEYVYKSGIDGYEKKTQAPNIEFDKQDNIYTVKNLKYTNETFKKDCKVRIALTGKTGIKYYIKKFEFFQLIKDDNNNIIYPDAIGDQVKYLEQNVVKNSYYYFTKEAVDSIKDPEELVPDYKTEELSYSTYVPVYNEGAQKIRTVSAKESNYFNILQSIAETFGAWLEIDVKHNDDGSIDKENKWIRFKNYVGKTNYANFRYGVNLKDIQRTYASKEIVTKLVVKPNSNQHANNGFCAIGRANSNPTGEDYIYDFRYFHEKGLLDSNKYLKDVYEPSADKDYTSTAGYYYKIKELNNEITKLNNEEIIPTDTELMQYRSEYSVADAGFKAAESGLEQVHEEFYQLTGIYISDLSAKQITDVQISNNNIYGVSTDRDGNIRYSPKFDSEDNQLFTIGTRVVKRAVGQFVIYLDVTINKKSTEKDKLIDGNEIEVKLYPKLVLASNNTTIVKELTTFLKFTNTQDFSQEVEVGGPLDQTRSDVRNKIIEYEFLEDKKKTYETQREDLDIKIRGLEEDLKNSQVELDNLKKQKTSLNLAFFKKYSRFIQEGTWIDEKYSDDELYYADALSVMYHSCYPKVAYTINVLALNMLPGYEGFTFELGDTTYAEDYEFFGDEKEEVTITEFIEFLDEPDKDTIKVQNFKNQFKDLFQKITATVQQAQYSTGSYEKAVALAEANQARKQQFLSDALSGASARLSAAGQQSVVWDNTGLTITDVDTPSNQIKMIGGAILLKKQDKNGQEKWTTGITSDGISASLITAGTINAGEIAIMNADEPVFRWDAFGISAFDFIAQENDFGTTIGAINPNKFVRFDKYGIYGINGNADGMTWHATSAENVEQLATFALTWEGLKVTGNNDNIVKVGRDDKYLISAREGDKDPFFYIDNDGNGQIGNVSFANIADKDQVKTAFDDFQAEIKKQIDQKADIYTGSEKPSNDEWGADNVGDIWFDTKNNKELIWAETEDGYGWVSSEFDIPDELKNKSRLLFDEEEPKDPQPGDVWVNDGAFKEYNKEVGRWVPMSEYATEKDLEGKLNASNFIDAFWDFNPEKGLLMWSDEPLCKKGTTNYGDFYKDTNMVFKVGKQDGIPKLWMRGNGQFDGNIVARSLTLGENVVLDAGNNNLIRGTNVALGSQDSVWTNSTDCSSHHELEVSGLDESESYKRTGIKIRITKVNQNTDAFYNYTRTILKFNKGKPYDSLFDFKPGKQYVFSCDLQIGKYDGNNNWVDVPDNEVISIKAGLCTIHHTGSLDVENKNEQWGARPNKWSTIKYSGRGWKRCSCVFTVRSDYDGMFEDGGDSDKQINKKDVGVYIHSYHVAIAQAFGDKVGASHDTNYVLKIANVKLEEGTIPTAWSLAQEEAPGFFKDDVNSTYSWKFDPNTGVKMWKGGQTTGEIFRIGDGGLYVKGTIAADKGSIGGDKGWSIKEQLLYSSFGSPAQYVGLFSGYDNEGATTSKSHLLPSVINPGKYSNVKIFAGATYLTDLSKSTFAVLADGSVHTSGIAIGQESNEITNTTLTKESIITQNISSHTASVSQLQGGAVLVGYRNTSLQYPWMSNSVGGEDTFFAFDQIEKNTESKEFKATLTKVSGENQFQVTVKEPLYQEKTFLIKYKVIWGGLAGINVTIKKGKTKGLSAEYSAFWGVSDFYFADTNSKEYTFFQAPEDANVNNYKCISAFGHLIPRDAYSYGDGISNFNIGMPSMFWNTLYVDKVIYKTDVSQDNGSDIRIKNNVELIPQKYEIFFDAMKPTRYKYNNGTSNRFHTGFIAQQLVESLEKAELTTQDFAGVFLHNPGEEDECWYLRRDEFVALNTWQIQKLKPRMTTAEEKIQQLELEVAELKQELATFKNQ